MANAETRIRITAEDKASKVIANVRQELLGMSGLGSRLGALASPLGAISGGVAALGAAVAGVRAFVGAIDDLSDTAEGLGVGAVALAEFRSKAAEGGVEAVKLDQALGKLNNKIAAAAAGNEEAARGFRAMGIAFKDASGNARSTEVVLGEIADRMRTYANTAEKAALLSELFGEKVGRNLAAYLSQGSEGLRQFTGLTEQTVKEANRLQGEIDKLATSFGRLANTLGGYAASGINSLIDAISGAGMNADPAARVERLQTRIVQLRAELARETRPQFVEAINRELSQVERTITALTKSMGTVKEQLFGGKAYGEGGGQLAPKIPEPANVEKAAKAMKQLAEATDDYARSIARELARERERQGVQEIEALAAAEERRADELDRLTELEGGLTRAQQERLRVIGELHAAERIGDAQLEKLTADVYGLKDATVEASDAARDLGLIFTSAFEDAIAGGESLSNIFKALERDLLKLGTRKLVTEPFLNWFQGAIGKDFNLGSLFASLFGGARAWGGPVAAGMPYLVGERGPEVFVPRASGTVVPNGRSAAMGNTINITVAGSATRETANQIAAAVSRTLRIAEARAFG